MIWLIGNKGMLGSKIETFLKRKNLTYFATDIELDITDKKIVFDFVKDIEINWIINCAAYTNVDKAEDEKELAYRINKDGVTNLAFIAKEKSSKIVHISTDYVFDGGKDSPYIETDLPNPINCYGESKLAGEKELINLTDRYFIIRTSWLYGENGKNFVNTMIKLMNEKDKISVVNDQIGSPTFTTDLAEFIFFLIEKESNEFGIYHFSNEGETSWFNFAAKIYEMARKKGIVRKNTAIEPIASVDYPTKAVRPKYSLFSKEKVKKTFNYKIRKWEEALQEYMSDMEKL